MVEQSGRNLESIVRFKDRNLPVVNIKVSKKTCGLINGVKLDYRETMIKQGDVLFQTWKSIFESGMSIPKNAAIYSFNGKNILTSPTW